MSVIFDRKVWCRYICALGNMCGIYAMASVLEVRANADVCINQCKTHECFKGGKVDGCPMFRHALFLEENQSCRLCTYCVKNCPYHAVQINLRPPGQELWNVQKPVAGAAFFSILLVTLVFAAVLPDLYGFEFSLRELFPYLPGSGMAAFTTLIILTVFASLVIFWSGELIFSDRRNSAHFARYSFAFIPLALCGHFANQLRYLPGADGLTAQLANHLEGVPTVFASFHVIWPLQLILVVAGVFWSLFVIYRNYSRDREEKVRREPRLLFYMFGLIGLYGVGIFWLFVALGRTL